MSEFVNTRDLIGDEALSSAMFSGTLEEYMDDEVLYVGPYTFQNASKLQYVDLPNVKELGFNAFNTCFNLHTLNIPSVTKIGNNAIAGGCKITELNLPLVTEVGNSILQGASSLETVKVPLLTSLKYYDFASNPKLKSVYLPSLTNFGNGYNFVGCTSLCDIYLPSVTSTNYNVFFNCTSLELVDLGYPNSNNGSRISGSGVFGNCYSLKALIIRAASAIGLQNVGSFNNCYHFHGTVDATYNPDGLKDGYIYVPRALVDTYKAATNWSTLATQFRPLEDYTVDGTITGPFRGALYSILEGDISSHYENNRVTSIREHAFHGVNGLTSVSLPNVITINPYAFSVCSELSIVNLPLVETIKAGAFADTAVSKLDLPKVSYMENAALRISNLETLILRSETICKINNKEALKNTKIANGTGYIYVPSTLVESYKTATNWTIYANQFRAIEDYPDICGGDA